MQCLDDSLPDRLLDISVELFAHNKYEVGGGSGIEDACGVDGSLGEYFFKGQIPLMFRFS